MRARAYAGAVMSLCKVERDREGVTGTEGWERDGRGMGEGERAETWAWLG